MPAPASLTDKTLGEAALLWATLGWSVFPVIPRGKTPYGTGEFCGRDDEHKCGFCCATTDPVSLASWWDAHPDSNIGLSAADAFVVDEDRIGALSQGGVSLPKCPWAVTGRAGGGRHFFLRAPVDWDGLQGDNVKVTYKVAGVEVKGFDKGYVVAAPSVHATGTRYELKAGGYVPEAPAAVIRQLVDVTGMVPLSTSLITVTRGGYTIPDVITENSRYKEIAAYTAHLYNRPMAVDEMWPLVLSLLAPHFSPSLSVPEIRERFERATKDMSRRLGEPRGSHLNGSTPPTLTLDDSALTEFDSRPIEWLWPAWLPRGVVTLMDGNPGVSKSTLVADLVARITTGRPWPDGTPPSRGPSRAMWITTEDDPGRVLRPRIEAAGGDASLVRFVTSEVVFPQAASAFLELLVERASEPLGLSLVILDPLFSHIDAKVKSIADADMRQGVMKPLGLAAEAADVSILVVRHFSKDTTASAINRGAGSLGGITGAARAGWGVITDPEDDSGKVKAVGVTKMNYAIEPPALRYRVVDKLPPGWLTGSVSGIEWLDAAPVSINSMMAEHTGISDAITTLREILTPGPVGAAHVKNLMRSRGFGNDATKSAKQRLGVVTTKTGMTGGWDWELPEGVEEAEGEGATPSPLLRSLAPAPARREGHNAHSFLSFEGVEGVPSVAPPAPARTREGQTGQPESAEPVVVVAATEQSIDCRWYDDHRDKHHWSDDAGRWVCDICSPLEVLT